MCKQPWLSLSRSNPAVSKTDAVTLCWLSHVADWQGWRGLPSESSCTFYRWTAYRTYAGRPEESKISYRTEGAGKSPQVQSYALTEHLRTQMLWPMCPLSSLGFPHLCILASPWVPQTLWRPHSCIWPHCHPWRYWCPTLQETEARSKSQVLIIHSYQKEVLNTPTFASLVYFTDKICNFLDLKYTP